MFGSGAFGVPRPLGIEPLHDAKVTAALRRHEGEHIFEKTSDTEVEVVESPTREGVTFNHPRLSNAPDRFRLIVSPDGIEDSLFPTESESRLRLVDDSGTPISPEGGATIAEEEEELCCLGGYVIPCQCRLSFQAWVFWCLFFVVPLFLCPACTNCLAK